MLNSATFMTIYTLHRHTIDKYNACVVSNNNIWTAFPPTLLTAVTHNRAQKMLAVPAHDSDYDDGDAIQPTPDMPPSRLGLRQCGPDEMCEGVEVEGVEEETVCEPAQKTSLRRRSKVRCSGYPYISWLR